MMTHGFKWKTKKKKQKSNKDRKNYAENELEHFVQIAVLFFVRMYTTPHNPTKSNAKWTDNKLINFTTINVLFIKNFLFCVRVYLRNECRTLWAAFSVIVVVTVTVCDAFFFLFTRNKRFTYTLSFNIFLISVKFNFHIWILIHWWRNQVLYSIIK